MKFLEKFSDALRQANKQHFRENIWIWGPYQFGTTFRVPKLFLSKIPPPYPSASPPPHLTPATFCGLFKTIFEISFLRL